MINALPSLANFDTTDPRILTILVIGTEDNVRNYILTQHRQGIPEAGTWSKPLPVPNCPGKVMSVINRMIHSD